MSQRSPRASARRAVARRTALAAAGALAAGLVALGACSAPPGLDDEADGPTAMVDVELVILRGKEVAHQTSLSTSDAQDAETGRITWIFTLPADYPLGPALLKTEGSRPLRVEVLR